jgi:RNA polymerase sigma-70 factor, ECF subfamily
MLRQTLTSIMIDEPNMQTAITDGQIIQLLPACQRGESAAIEQLYELYADRIYRYILARTGDAEAAADMTTDVFLRLLKHAGGLRLDAKHPAASFSAWLYRVAANTVTDFRRKQSRRPTIALDEDLALASGEPDLVSTAVKREEAIRLAGALDTLTEDQRQVVIGKFTEGLSNRQIASRLGKTEGAVEALQHRALRALGRLLAPHIDIGLGTPSAAQAPGVSGPHGSEERVR